MIETRFEDYCDGCDELDPEVGVLWAYGKVVKDVIVCSHRERCGRIYDHMTEIMKNVLGSTDNESTR